MNVDEGKGFKLHAELSSGTRGIKFGLSLQ